MSPIVPIPLPYPPEVMRFLPTGRVFSGKILLPVVTHPSGTTRAYTGAITLPAHVKHFQTVTSTVTASASTGFAAAVAAGTVRDPWLRPFDKFSPVNWPIGTGAVYAAVSKGNGPGGGTSGGFSTCTIQGSARFSTYAYVALASDPLHNWTNNTRTSSRGPTFIYPTNVFTRRIPAAALTANLTGEGRVVVVTPDHLTATEGGNLSLDGSGGFISPGFGGMQYNVDLKGNGCNPTATIGIYYTSGEENTPVPTGSPANGTSVSVDGTLNTCGFSLLAGLIRAGELANGIPHALRFNPPNIYWNRNAPGGGSQVWPANSSDDPTPYGVAGNLYFGGLMALPPSFNVNGMLTVQGTNLAKACQSYGLYGCASTTTGSVGTDTFLIFMESNAVQNGEIPSSANFQTDLNTIASALQVVTNSHHLGGIPLIGHKLDGGDGTVNAALIQPPFDR